MTREQLEVVHGALTELVDSWNDAAADEDRGRGNNALVLVLHDDGSGLIGQKHWGCDDVQPHYEFDNFDELVKALKDGEGVDFEA